MSLINMEIWQLYFSPFFPALEGFNPIQGGRTHTCEIFPNTSLPFPLAGGEWVLPALGARKTSCSMGNDVVSNFVGPSGPARTKKESWGLLCGGIGGRRGRWGGGTACEALRAPAVLEPCQLPPRDSTYRLFKAREQLKCCISPRTLSCKQQKPSLAGGSWKGSYQRLLGISQN